ncbi:MAG: adenylate/guanylate cyclase domain-containing protein, partial [bacterium]|nr:adenylate/guanylate cyclase domain-containing protein [bacterium]
MKNTSNLVLKEITTDINPIQINGNFSANIFSSGLIKDDPDKLITYTYYLVNSIPLLQGAYWGNKHGDLVYAAQEADGTISSEVILRSHFPFSHTKTYHDLKGNITKKLDLADNHFDPRTRPWYIKASTSHGVPAWTPVYMFYALNTLGITLAAPVMDKQKNFLGAFGLDISLDFLSQFITKLSISPNGYAFIITKDEDLIAYSRIKPFLETKALPNQLLNVHKSSNLTLIDKSIDYYKKMGESEFTIEYQGEDYLVSYRPIPAFVTEGWLIGVIAPQNDFIGYLHKINMITFMFAMLILGIGLLITSRLVTLIVKPIKILVKETEKIKRFELDNKIHLSSRIKEVINLRDALASMKNGLQQFQRYLPKVLVRQLIESGQNIHVGGVRKELVVFFSDIENFTTIAETLDPNELMTQICEYFEVLTQIIILEKGTIDKYIGDSIMAFWGAPLHTTHASKHAARSALHCITAVEELNAKWASQGRPQLITRIGIHKGEAIVG